MAKLLQNTLFELLVALDRNMLMAVKYLQYTLKSTIDRNSAIERSFVMYRCLETK